MACAARALAGWRARWATDEAWLEEQLQGLLWAMLRAEPGWRARGLRLQGLSRSAHAELLERVDRATDYILSQFALPITLDQIAAAAMLSKYHLVRTFREVHGTTPMALLTRVRTLAAQRLLKDTSLPLHEVLARSGFGSRQTLFRQLRRHCGAGGRELRRESQRRRFRATRPRSRAPRPCLRRRSR